MAPPLIAPAALALAPLAGLPAGNAPVAIEHVVLAPPQAITLQLAPPPAGDPGAASATAAPPAVPSEPVQAGAGQAQPAVEPRHHHAPGDPLEGFNRAMFNGSQALDKAIYRPAAMAYKHVVPKPMRSGIRNILSNLTEPVVFLNFLLQGKPREAMQTLARFLLNSTLGVGGAFDVAKKDPIDLPHRDNGLGTTLAIYGVGPGPYLYLPFIGPTTLRDVLGDSTDGLALPIGIGHPFDTTEYQLTTAVVGGLDLRAESDEELRALFSDAVDPYATMRSVWLQNRSAEIDAIRGKPAAKAVPDLPELEDPLADPAQSAKQPAPEPDTSTPPELSDPLEDPAASPSGS